LQNHVLVVDDEFIIAETLCMHVEDFGLKVCGTASDADTAVALAQEHRPAVVLMDVRLLGKKDGVDAALAINATVGSKVIFITGSIDPATLARIHMDHPFAVLFKPFSVGKLRTSIEAAMN
jgi:DNA-binding NtrC family response regulator